MITIRPQSAYLVIDACSLLVKKDSGIFPRGTRATQIHQTSCVCVVLCLGVGIPKPGGGFAQCCPQDPVL